ncbi:MAG: D-Ala-D-Ala carboxypeptidase family metallohydrolase [Pseudomonadota bacterium]
MSKISLDELRQKLADPNTTEEELRQYFKLTDRSGPFAPDVEIDFDAVAAPEGPGADQRSAALINLANQWARWRRESKFIKRIEGGYDGPVLVSEGDSWFQYPLLLKDTIDHLTRPYAIKSLGAAGDLLERMVRKREYLGALEETGAPILLLSGGGNDLCAGGALADHLEEFRKGKLPGDYLLPSYQGLIDEALGNYETIFTDVARHYPDVTILCHGYDYPIPNNGQWLGNPMKTRGIKDKGLQKAIADEMMNIFNRGLRRLADRMAHVEYLDLRGVVGDDRWHDELHPIDEGYRDVAQVFEAKIADVLGTSPGKRATPALLTGSGGAQARSLHLGLNFVDPVHYDGWDGELVACENDAHAMEALAQGEGFQTVKLLTADATRGAVVEEIEAAARDLKTGDMFLMTVSAHGGQVHDFNNDEFADDRRKLDETLCLYDSQLVDDELYKLWSNFAPGVRILMIPDTCHSGTMVRADAPPPALSFMPQAARPRHRRMPSAMIRRVMMRNVDHYREIARSTSGIDESVILSGKQTPIKANVMQIGACLDHQFANDGDDFGAFTGTLLDVWDNGRFKGDYKEFHRQIAARIGIPDQTPKFLELPPRDAMFAAQRPFAVAGGATPMTTIRPAPRPKGPTADPAPVPPAPVIRPGSAIDYLNAVEGGESDALDAASLAALFDRNETERRSRGASDWPNFPAFAAFIEGLELDHFSPEEFLVLGASHENPAHPGFGKNTFPPESAWPNIANTARVLDALRKKLDKPVAITNAYRSPAYNEAVGGAEHSQHKRFNACDVQVRDVSPEEVADTLTGLRADGIFSGGIGRYKTFTHIDTRGVNRNWGSNRGGPVAAPMLNRSAAKELITDLANADFNIPKGGPRRPRSGQSDDSPAAINGRTLMSFVDPLPAEQRRDVLYSTQFAQRAADARVDPTRDREAWWAIYTRALAAVGWVTQGAPFRRITTDKSNFEFDAVVLDILAAVASGGQLAAITATLDALKGLADDNARIKLFDFHTQTTVGGSFHLAAAESGPTGAVSMALGALQYRNVDKQQNILFFKWGSQSTEVWVAAQSLTFNVDFYEDVARAHVEAKLADAAKLILAFDLAPA